MIHGSLLTEKDIQMDAQIPYLKLNPEYYYKIGASFDWKTVGEDFKHYPDFYFNIDNEKNIYIGRTHIYEATQPICCSQIQFPMGVPESLRLNILVCSEEEIQTDE